MDTKFLNYFNEVAQENFVAIAKQNLIFQAQIKYLEEDVKKIPELLETIAGLEETKKEVAGMVQEITDLKNQLENKENIIKVTSNSDADRHRLQTALNNQAQDLEKLKKRVVDFEKEIETQKEYIGQLEEMLPNSKKKKLGIVVEAPVVTDKVKEEEKLEETPKIDDVKLKIQSSGGTF